MAIEKNQAWPHRVGVMAHVFKAFAAVSGAVRCLEMGVWFGKGSTQIWLKHAPKASEFILIDSWKPYASKSDLSSTEHNYKEMDDLSTDAFLSAFLEVKNIEAIRRDDELKISLVRGDSRVFTKNIVPGNFNFIYIDGDHKYEGVKKDIAEAKRLIAQDFGIICGDDLEVMPSDELLGICRENLETDFLRSPVCFHPGVMLAIHEEFGVVNMHNGFWWIVVKDGQFRLDLLRPE